MAKETRIADWVIDRQLGRGGMATVFECHSVLAPRLRGALKLMPAGRDSGSETRFLREVDALARLRHHGLVRVLAAGQTKRGALYMVMELIEGENLLQRLQREPLEVPEALNAFRIVADGLRHAHDKGIHHRDLKPSNVMLTPDGGACLVDFGIALDVEHSRLTRAGTVAGTVTYMAPELLSVDNQDVAPGPCDVYSLGQVLCEALTGSRAFQSARGTHGLVKLVQEKHKSGPLDPGPEFSMAIRDLVRFTTEPNPKARPNMAQVVRLLDGALSPDKIELDAIEEATRVFDSEEVGIEVGGGAPGEVTEELPDLEDRKDTLAMRIVRTAEERRNVGIEQDLGTAQDEISLLEPTQPENLIFEDEEGAQAFESAEIMDQWRAQQKRTQLRQVVIAASLGALLAAVVVGVAVLGFLVLWYRP